jgi:hypothetical protein
VSITSPRSTAQKLKLVVSVAAIVAVVTANAPAVLAAPTVTITSPTTNSVQQGTITLTAAASVGTLGVRFKLGNCYLGPEDVLAPYTYNWDTTKNCAGVVANLNNVNYTVTAEARDLTGSATSAPVTIKLNNPAFPGTVMVVGDSLSQQAFDPNADNTQTFTTNAPVASLRNVNVKMGWAVPNIQTHVSNYAIFRWPERLVVALGANDASPLFNADGWTNTDLQNFRTLINTVHTNSCVVLVLPYAGSAANAAWAAEINEARTAIATLANERPRTLVADWADVVAEHPEYVDEDGIHLLTPNHTPTEDLIAASQGQLNPVDQAAADARQNFYWSSAAQCAQFN